MRIDEIAADTYRLSTYVPDLDMQFNHFLVLDEEPLLFHAGLRRMFGDLREAVARLVDPARLRWIGFSHFESDECGALNSWLEIAPRATPLCGQVGAVVSVDDFALRPARGMADGEVLTTGRRRFRFCQTAHLPHGWDAGVLFEEEEGTLFCSDLFHQFGDREPLTEDDLLGRAREALLGMQAGPLADYAPYTPRTDAIFDSLAALRPRTLAVMHGSSFTGDCAHSIRGLKGLFREILSVTPDARRGAAALATP